MAAGEMICSSGDGGEKRVYFPALPPGGEKPPVAHETELLPGGKRFRRSQHRLETAFQRRVVFAVARGVGRAGGARRGCVASVREILAEDGFRPAVRADRAGGGVVILRKTLKDAAATGSGVGSGVAVGSGVGVVVGSGVAVGEAVGAVASVVVGSGCAGAPQAVRSAQSSANIRRKEIRFFVAGVLSPAYSARWV